MLRQRVLTALILGPIVLWLVLWAPSLITVPVITAIVLIGAWEWAQFCGFTLRSTRFRYVLMIAVGMALAWRYSGISGVSSNLFGVALIWWCVALGWIAIAPLRGNRWAAATAGVFVLVPTWSALIHLHLAGERGRYLLLFLLLLIFSADIGAYFAGRALGKVKLAPLVSPGKTWEGVLGGVMSAAIIAVGGAYWFGFPINVFLALCSAVVVGSIVGDLTESMFKRHVGLKDSGTLLPGHGGILDRIDSITAAAPLFALGLMWLGVLT